MYLDKPLTAKYLYNMLEHKQACNSIERLVNTLFNSHINLTPHQIEAALFAFKSPLNKGCILADEVGLGKTIEAGIVLAQMWSENKRRILQKRYEENEWWRNSQMVIRLCWGNFWKSDKK